MRPPQHSIQTYDILWRVIAYALRIEFLMFCQLRSAPALRLPGNFINNVLNRCKDVPGPLIRNHFLFQFQRSGTDVCRFNRTARSFLFTTFIDSNVTGAHHK